MTRILIPTRNRPSSLKSVLDYLNEFFPHTEVIVADGSSAEHAEKNALNIKNHDYRIGIDYRQFPYELPIFDRLLTVLSGESDEFFIMGSDDDYPLVSALEGLKSLLEADSNAVTAMGATLNLFFRPDGKAIARLSTSRTIRSKSAKSRVSAFASWPFSTTYAVSRRELLIERYRRARNLFIAGFFDFGVGLQDCAHGNIIASDSFSYIATRNFRHSYVRKNRRMMFLDQSSEILQLINCTVDDLVRFDQMERDDAEKLSEELFRVRIAEHVGFGPDRMKGFEFSAPFLNPVVQRQMARFEQVFSENSVSRDELEPYLRLIGQRIQEVLRSSDNIGEAHNVSTLAQQTSQEISNKEEPQEFYNLPVQRGRRRIGAISPETWLWEDMPNSEAIHVLAMGQSNIGNHGLSCSESKFGFTDVDGEKHALKDPIPGGTGDGGSVWSRVGEKVAIREIFASFQLTLIAKENTSIADWLQDARAENGLKATLERLALGSSKVNCIVWHQGEKDNKLRTTSENYFAYFKQFHEEVSKYIPKIPWIICRTSHSAGKINKHIIVAQNSIIRTIDGCIEGPNTDILNNGYRHDGTHLNNEGMSIFADFLVDHFSRLKL